MEISPHFIVRPMAIDTADSQTERQPEVTPLPFVRYASMRAAILITILAYLFVRWKADSVGSHRVCTPSITPTSAS